MKAKHWVILVIALAIIASFTFLIYSAMNSPDSVVSPDKYLAIYILGFVVIGMIALFAGVMIEDMFW